MMLKSILSIVLVSTVLTAGEYTVKERIADMKELETGMANVQKGLLYNDVVLIAEGVGIIKENAKSVEPPLQGDEKYFDKHETYSYTYTKRQAAKMIVHADDILLDYKEGNTKQAMNVYTKVFKQCMSCHDRMREW